MGYALFVRGRTGYGGRKVKEQDMTLSTVMLIVLGVIVLVALAVAASALIRQRQDERDRARGAELREQAHQDQNHH